MREKMKTDTSLLVVGGADEQVRAWGFSETWSGLKFNSDEIE